MREIFFRGIWVHGNNEWIEGDLVRDSEGNPHIVDSEYNEYWDGDPIFVCEEECMVKPETVGQYTGLTDKNGKKVFEGDIVDITYPETIVRNALVTYVGASFYGDNGNDLWVFDDYISFEVIGNIHDNKELLEVN
jgi:uncharacterized phage protein (TIGR01671 family)